VSTTFSLTFVLNYVYYKLNQFNLNDLPKKQNIPLLLSRGMFFAHKLSKYCQYKLLNILYDNASNIRHKNVYFKSIVGITLQGISYDRAILALIDHSRADGSGRRDKGLKINPAIWRGFHLPGTSKDLISSPPLQPTAPTAQQAAVDCPRASLSLV
jgi:hypothetical protein